MTMIKLKDILGLTNYLFSKDNFSSYDKFKLQRYFVDNFRVTKGNLDFRTQPTWQNFKHDELLANAKANGIKNIWCTQGAFDWQGVQGKQGKVMPIRDGDSALDPQSWRDIGELCRQVAIRYANDTSHLLAESKVFQGEPAYLSNTPKAGLDLLEAIEIQNEWDFKKEWSGATRTITPEEYAVCFKVCYDAIRRVSNIKVIMGGGISPVMSTFERFLGKLDSLYQAEGKETPNDFYLCFHWYMRNGSQDQGGGTAGISPEEANAYEFGQSLDDLCQQRGLLGWYCTETGWATDDSKQSAPIQEGFTREQSQGLLMIRLALIWGASQYCKGITFWHVRDDYDSPPYAKGGVNYKDWSAKPARTICEAFLSKYGEFECSSFQGNATSNIYYITFSNGKSLTWTDKVKIGTITPMPMETEPPQPPTMRHPKKQGSTIVWSDTGERIRIKELGSPETLLAKSFDDFKAIVDYAADVCGLNTIYCTLYAGDNLSATLHPYNGTKEVTIPNGTKKQMGDPASGFNMAWLADIRRKLEYAASKGMLLHLLTSEKENHHVHTDAQQDTLTDMLLAQFDHLPIIWDREEVPINNIGGITYAAWIRRHYSYLKARTQNVTAIHNNTGEKPWVGFADIIDLISIQADVSSFDSIIKAEAANGFSPYSSEVTGGIAPGDTARAAKVRDAGGSASCGAGAYLPPIDQSATLAQIKTYESVLKTIANTQTPPNPTPMKIQYTTANNHPANAPELTEGTSIIPGNYSVFTDVAGTFDLYKNNARQPGFPKPESQPPFDMWGTTGTSANLYPFTEGGWRLVFTPKTGTAVTVNFTVGTITPPPPQKEPIIEEYIEAGTHYVARTASGTYKVAVTKV